MLCRDLVCRRTRPRHGQVGINAVSAALLTCSNATAQCRSATTRGEVDRTPKAINISSGLGRLTNQKIRKVDRYPHGVSKIGTNEVLMRGQVTEDDRMKVEPEGEHISADGHIIFVSLRRRLLRLLLRTIQFVAKALKRGQGSWHLKVHMNLTR